MTAPPSMQHEAVVDGTYPGSMHHHMQKVLKMPEVNKSPVIQYHQHRDIETCYYSQYAAVSLQWARANNGIQVFLAMSFRLGLQTSQWTLASGTIRSRHAWPKVRAGRVAATVTHPAMGFRVITPENFWNSWRKIIHSDALLGNKCALNWTPNVLF